MKYPDVKIKLTSRSVKMPRRVYIRLITEKQLHTRDEVKDYISAVGLNYIQDYIDQFETDTNTKQLDYLGINGLPIR
jgi:hypothetical protein